MLVLSFPAVTPARTGRRTRFAYHGRVRQVPRGDVVETNDIIGLFTRSSFSKGLDRSPPAMIAVRPAIASVPPAAVALALALALLERVRLRAGGPFRPAELLSQPRAARRAARRRRRRFDDFRLPANNGHETLSRRSRLDEARRRAGARHGEPRQARPQCHGGLHRAHARPPATTPKWRRRIFRPAITRLPRHFPAGAIRRRIARTCC